MSSPPFFSANNVIPNPIRTNEDFTTGIVNVPLNTPATIILKVRDLSKFNDAKTVFDFYKIPFEVQQLRTKAFLKSSVLVHRDYIEAIKRKYPQFEPVTKNYYRYIFFELDDLDEAHVRQVLSVYDKYRLPVFYHRTMRGWHFFCIKPVDEDTYQEAMTELKPLNMACPHVTMRIRPNKWVGEREIFKLHKIVMPALHSDTERFARMITEQTYPKLAQKIGQGKWLLDRKYLLVDYRQTGELANK